MQDQILDFLRKNDGYLSGEELSRQLKISRAAVWKNIEELRKEGYDIAAVPHLGYRLTSVPDKLFPQEIQYHLKTKQLGKNIVYFETIPTTMDHAFQLGVQGAEEGTVVCAETQTKGRGRLGRSWNSPKGKGIYMSVILRPAFSPSEVAQFTLLAAVAVREAIAKVSGVQAQIKWPNDLLVNQKKLAGILTEMSAEADRVRFIVIGIGVNVNTLLSHLPEEATSLKELTGKSISRLDLVREILISLEKWYEHLKAKGFSEIMAEWKKFSCTLGNRIRIMDMDGQVEGEAVDLDEYGGLVIRRDNGVMVKRMSGDVVVVKR